VGLLVVVLLVAAAWLLPTFGLFIESLRDPADSASTGWWTVFTKPSQLTVDSYQKLLENSDITNSLVNTVLITVPATVLVVVIGSLAGYAFAWMEFPGRDWWFLGVVGLLVVAGARQWLRRRHLLFARQPAAATRAAGSTA
jgi:alpha-glucoside transport system permease protein